MDSWTDEVIISYLEKLQQLPCLWNRHHKYYRNTVIRSNALCILCKHVNIPGYGAQTMHRKMFEIKGVFMEEKRRMYENQKAGKQCKPRFSWYEAAHKFWGKTPLSQKCSPNFDEADDITSANDRLPSRNNWRSFKRPTSVEYSGAVKRTMTDEAFAKCIGKATNALRHVVALNSMDEFDAFGRSVAYQLKSMNAKGAYELQAEIQTLITAKKIKYLSASFFRHQSTPGLRAPPLRPQLVQSNSRRHSKRRSAMPALLTTPRSPTQPLLGTPLELDVIEIEDDDLDRNLIENGETCKIKVKKEFNEENGESTKEFKN